MSNSANLEIKEPKYILEIKISGLPKMANQHLRQHWAVSRKHGTLWKRKVWAACWHIKPPQPLDSAALSLTRVSTHEPDWDGLVSGFKHVIDGLVEARVLAGDKQSNIGQPTYKWERGFRGHGHIKIRVEEK